MITVSSRKKGVDDKDRPSASPSCDPSRQESPAEGQWSGGPELSLWGSKGTLCSQQAHSPFLDGGHTPAIIKDRPHGTQRDSGGKARVSELQS